MESLQNLIIKQVSLRDIIEQDFLESGLSYAIVDKIKQRFTLESLRREGLLSVETPTTYLLLAIGNSNLDKWLWPYLVSDETSWDEVKYLSPIRQQLLDEYLRSHGLSYEEFQPQLEVALMAFIEDVMMFLLNPGLLLEYDGFSAIWEHTNKSAYSLILNFEDPELGWVPSRLNVNTIDAVLARLLQQCIDTSIMTRLFVPENPILLDENRRLELIELSLQHPPIVNLWSRLSHDYAKITDRDNLTPNIFKIDNFVYVVNDTLVVLGYNGAVTYNEDNGRLLLNLLAVDSENYVTESWEETAADIGEYLDWQSNDKFEVIRNDQVIAGYLNELPVIVFI